jgi:hypothetical protein
MNRTNSSVPAIRRTPQPKERAMRIIPVQPPADKEAAETSATTPSRRTFGRKLPPSRRTFGKRLPPSRRTFGRKIP